VERRRRDAGTEPERNDRRRTAGGKPADYSASGMPLVTSALCCGRNRRGREGHRADRQPVMGARKRVGHGGVQNSFSRAKDFGNLHNRRWSPIKKLNFFIALKTLDENGVETEKQPSRPA